MLTLSQIIYGVHVSGSECDKAVLLIYTLIDRAPCFW